MLDPGGLPNPTTLWMDSGYSFFPDLSIQPPIPALISPPRPTGSTTPSGGSTGIASLFYDLR